MKIKIHQLFYFALTIFLYFSVANNILIATSYPIKDKGQQLLTQSYLGNHAKVKSLIKAGADLDTKDTNKDTALIIATYKGFYSIADLLVRNGA